MHITRLWPVLIVGTLLSACGGSDGHSSSPAVTPDEQQPSAGDNNDHADGSDTPTSPEPTQPSTPPDQQNNCSFPPLPALKAKTLLAELGQPDSYNLDLYQEHDAASPVGVWLAIHRVDAITDLGQRGRDIDQVWHSSTLLVREHDTGYQIANCGLEGGWHSWPDTQQIVDLPLFVGPGLHPQFRLDSNNRFTAITLTDLSADQGPQRRPVSFANQQTAMIRLGDSLASLGQVEQQINQLSINQPIQCFTRRLERRYQQECGKDAQLDVTRQMR